LKNIYVCSFKLLALFSKASIWISLTYISTDKHAFLQGGAVETLDKIFSKAGGGIDKGQITKVAQSAAGLIESALVTATTTPANSTNSNSTAEVGLITTNYSLASLATLVKIRIMRRD